MNAPNMETWTEAQRAAYASALAGLDIERAELEQSAKPTPEELVEQLVAEKEAVCAARALATRDKLDDKAYARACKEFGATRVGRLRTREGSIIFRAMDGAEMDSYTLRLDELETPVDRMKALREGFVGCVLHPDPAATRRLFDRFPKLWDHAFDAMGTLNAGVEREARGKG